MDQSINELYRVMKLIRRAEEVTAEIYPSDKIKSPVHLSIGQEAVSAGVCSVLQDDDVVSGTYRGHAAYLAKGGSLRAMMAEMYGKATGCAAGKGGSMHLVNMEANVLGASAVVGTTIPMSVGYAMALKRQGQGGVVVSFFGDGATEEGAFYESVNFAALHRLPILFVCENNLYAIHTPLRKRWASDALVERMHTFGLESQRVGDGDVLKIRCAAAPAAHRIRSGGGPEFLECVVYRWREHVGPNEDFDAGYRSAEEAQQWIENDQVKRLAEMLEAAERERIDRDVEAEIDDAVRFAESSPVPAATELYSHVYAD